MKKLLTIMMTVFLLSTMSLNVGAKFTQVNVPLKLSSLISFEKETLFYQAPNSEVDSVDFSRYSTIYIIKVSPLVINKKGGSVVITSGKVIGGEGYLMNSSYFTPTYRNVLNGILPSSGGYLYLQMLSPVGRQIQLELTVNGYKQKFIIATPYKNSPISKTMRQITR